MPPARAITATMDFLQPIIRAYQTTFQNPFMLLFTVLSFVQLYRGGQRINVLRNSGKPWIAEPFTHWRRQLGEDISFYVAVPLGVLIHELGHAIVVWVLGGQVIEFGFFFFWGYVLPSQSWGPVAEWILSSAGTWGNVLFALVVWLIWRKHEVRAVRYAMLRTVRFQIYFAFLYYPLFTAVLQIGDWRTIYDFEATPMLSGGMAIVHALILAAYWWLDRSGAFDMAAFDSVEAQAHFDQLVNLKTPESQIERLQMLQRGGLAAQAQRLAKELVATYPDSAEIHLHAAFTGFRSTEDVTQLAAQNARKALDLGLAEPFQRMEANFILGGYHLRRNETSKAIDHYNEALIQRGTVTHGNTHRIYHARSSAFRRANQSEPALSDLDQAWQLAQRHGQLEWAKRYEEELAALRDARR
ncbi:MAG: hypothetical protein ACPG8W_25670 [Candidatus Promineifilaceae bacterium]